MVLQAPPPEIMMSQKVYHAFNYYQCFVVCSVFPHVPKFILFFAVFSRSFGKDFSLVLLDQGLAEQMKLLGVVIGIN